MDVAKIQEKKAALEEELLRTERQIYDLEGEYLQAHYADPCAALPLTNYHYHSPTTIVHTPCPVHNLEI